MKGWYGNKQRHHLASRGVKSNNKQDTNPENRIIETRINKILLICDTNSVDCNRLIEFIKQYDFRPTSVIHIAESKDLINYYIGDEEVEYDFTHHEDEPEYPYIAKRRNYDMDEPEILVASDLNNFDTDQIILSILHEHGHTKHPYKNEEWVENWAYNEYRKWDDAILRRIQ